MNDIFEYKVLDNHKCGFPETSLEKVLERLEDNKINYHIIYTYKEPIIKEFGKLNKYKKFYNNVLKNIDKKKRIDMIIEKITNATPKEVEKILEILEDVCN